MKKSTLNNLITTALGVCVCSAFIGFASYVENMPCEVVRNESARYYTANNGTIITADGHEWGYSATVLGDAFQADDGSVIFANIEHEPKNDVPVWVKINDKATPDDYSDDEILKVGLDFCAYMDEVIAANDAYIAELQAKYAK